MTNSKPPQRKHVKKWDAAVLEARKCYPKRAKASLEKLSEITSGLSDSYFTRDWPVDESRLTQDEKIGLDLGRLGFYVAMGDVANWLGESCSDAFQLVELLGYLDRIINNVRFLSYFQDDGFDLSSRMYQADIRRAKEMRKALAQKSAPIISKRKTLLAGFGCDLEKIRSSRKYAESIVTEFADVCVKNGVRAVSAKQIQRDAQDILKERRKISGQP